MASVLCPLTQKKEVALMPQACMLATLVISRSNWPSRHSTHFLAEANEQTFFSPCTDGVV